jgi:hypothetical protein
VVKSRRSRWAGHVPRMEEGMTAFKILTSKPTEIVKRYLALREECRLRVFENKILRRIFGLKKDENAEWRRLHNEELHSLFRSPNIVRVTKSRRLGWAGHVARMEEGRNSFNILTGKPTGKRPLGRPRRTWEDKIIMVLEKKGINAGNWVDLAQDRDYWRALVNATLNLRVPEAMEIYS